MTRTSRRSRPPSSSSTAPLAIARARSDSGTNVRPAASTTFVGRSSGARHAGDSGTRRTCWSRSATGAWLTTLRSGKWRSLSVLPARGLPARARLPALRDSGRRPADCAGPREAAEAAPESGPLTFVRLRGVHQERMTQVHRARIAGGGDDRAVRAPSESISSQLPQRQPLLSCWSQLPGDVRM